MFSPCSKPFFRNLPGILLLAISCLLQVSSLAQSFCFAHVSDTHIGNPTAAEDLRRTVADINGLDSISFVVLSGDITEFGSDEELTLAKQILDSLRKPWYIIPGNHDGNWSESGANSFRRIFGAEHFRFDYKGYVFLGTNSGPNLRMSPGQVPREHIVWLDSTLKTISQEQPIIYINHYPQDTSLNNWYEATDRLKKKNIQLIMLGHGHANKLYSFEGIPAVMGRSNLRAKDAVGEYNIVVVRNGSVLYTERVPGVETKPVWANVPLVNHHFEKDTTRYFRPSFAINLQYPQVKAKWQYQDKSDIGSGVAADQQAIFATNTAGLIYALDQRSGKRIWSFQTSGKIYGTPVVWNGKVVVGSTDNNIYCLSAKNGKLLWQHKTGKAVLGSAVVDKGIAFIGASDGKFRAIDVETGALKWTFDEVAGFVVTRPLVYLDKVFFGCWNNDFYALDASTGSLVWKWNNGSTNRMYSPAACYPVASGNRIFLVAPDRFMTALNAQTGSVVWRNRDAQTRVRESMGIAADASRIYAKTMDGELVQFSALADSMQVVHRTDLQVGYELAPTSIVEKEDLIFVPSHDGEMTAVKTKDGTIAWKHKISNCLITGILPLGIRQVVVTTMDGIVALLQW